MTIYFRLQLSIFAILLLVGPFFAGNIFAGTREPLTVTGTGSSIGAMQIMAKVFQKKYPAVAVQVLPSIGSTGGIKAVQEGKIGIGLSSRLLKPEEQSASIIEEPYGRAAFVFGVQASNSTKGFTLAEIEDIYAGTRKAWSDGTPIRLILRPLSDAYSTYLANINPGLKLASAKAHSIPGVYVGNTDQEAAIQIEKTSGSFGTTSSSLVAAEKRKIKALSVDGVAPTLSNVSTGKYPFAMTLTIVYKRDAYKGSVRDFTEFIFSKDGQKILSDNGHVTIRRGSRK
jgi:phosphate transport system substrate-binding protein